MNLKLSNIKIEHFYNIGSCEEYYGSTSKLKESSKLANTTLYSIYKISIHKFLLNFFGKIIILIIQILTKYLML